MPIPPSFRVRVTLKESRTADGADNDVEVSRSVVLTEDKARALHDSNPAIAPYLKRKSGGGVALVADSEQLTRMGFAHLARQIEAEAARLVAQKKLRR